MTPSGKHRMVIGKYDVRSNMLKDARVIDPPSNTDCEKNWLIVSSHSENEDLRVIYDWHPMRVGIIKDSALRIEDSALRIEDRASQSGGEVLHITAVHNSPLFFSRMRGSSNPVEYEGALWCVGHIVHFDGGKRKYFHVLIKLNKASLAVEAYSLPFCFKKKQVEYCLGHYMKDDKCIFFFSENDSCPGMIEIGLSAFTFINVY
jgi:hypothetical protein